MTHLKHVIVSHPTIFLIYIPYIAVVTKQNHEIFTEQRRYHGDYLINKYISSQCFGAGLVY